MPEENHIIDLERILDLLEDPILDKPLVRNQHCKSIIAALDNGVEISTSVLNRLLAVSLHDLQDDKKNALHGLRIIQSILKRIKVGDISALPNLLPSILAVLNIVKTSALMSKMETMQKLCFEILLSYPDETLIEIATLHTSEIIEVENLYGHQQIPLQVRVLPCALILKLLKILPSEKKSAFVKDNVSTWFSKIIPALVCNASNDTYIGNEANSMTLDTLEYLTNELVPIDYSENPQWFDILECIYNPQKYPAMLKQMLQNHSNTWHRLWIVFIRLLKQQITKTTFSSASPINSMLPVVELAFKMDVTNRCRAFQCWDILIDNFSSETNEAYVSKRLKLLIIPLKSNNAKVEETAAAKLKTWWHLIRCYQTKLDKFVDKVLISFLHFCFGRHSGSSPKSSFVPGLVNANMKKLCVEAFVELAGHKSCNGCVDMPRLDTNIITNSILIDYWNDWVYSFALAVGILNEDVGIKEKHIECLWKSIVMKIAELPDNTVRKDLFNELLTVLGGYLEKSEQNTKMCNIVFHLTLSLFTEDKIKVLFKPNEEKGPIYKITLLLLSPYLNIFYRSGDTSKIVRRLKPFTNYMLDTNMCVPGLLNLNPEPQNISFILTALAESVLEFDLNKPIMWELSELIQWPLKPTNVFIDVEYSTKVWVKLINNLYPKMKTFIKTFKQSLNINCALHLKLNLCIAILNYELETDSVVGCTRNTELLCMVTNKIDDYKIIRDNLQVLTDTVIKLINKIDEYSESSTLLNNTLYIIKNILKFLIPILEETDEAIKMNKKLFEKLLNHLQGQNNINSAVISSVVMEELLKLTTFMQTHPTLKKPILNIFSSYLNNGSNGLPIYKQVMAAVEILSPKQDSSKHASPLRNDKFVAPVLKTSTKKTKKKEMTIVNTVTENGEEYEVIKSTWKFNPRKLTENQKEKLQRKREDIPALYQDLSQSQDEFKLSVWKTDSQDASSTNSRSTTNNSSSNAGNVSEILKNIPSSDVVPKIIENIFSEKKDAVNKEEKTMAETTSKIKQTIIKDTKSPRLALKDRVFRNVRNLIEKSNVQKDTKDLSESLIQVENVPKTPTSKTIEHINVVNSAPPSFPDRPSRLKRKPKKFDDVQIFSLKKSRRSSSVNDSQSDSQIDCQVTNENVHDQNSPSSITMDVETKDDNTNTANNNTFSSSTTSENPDVKAKDDMTNNIPIEKHASEVEPNVQNKVAEHGGSYTLGEKIGLDKESSFIIALHSARMTESAATTTESKQNNPDTAPKRDIIISDDKDKTMECKPHETSLNVSTSILKVDKVEDALPSAEIPVVVAEVTKVDLTNDNKTPNIRNKNVRTPKQSKKEENVDQKSGKKNTVRKSRIEKELAIDTVEGHPFLKTQTDKRITRKHLNNVLNNSRRKSLTDKLNKTKNESKTPLKTQSSCAKKKEKEISNTSDRVIVDESQEKCSDISDELPHSEDIIESSQDSTFTTISVKPSKTVKKLSVVVHKVPLVPSVESVPEMKDSRTEFTINTSNAVGKDDSELPQNKTAITNDTDLDLTENMDTQPVDNKAIEENEGSSEVVIINDDEEPIVISAETQEIAEADTQPTNLSSETQEIAEADTQPTNLSSETQEIAEADTKPTKPILETQEIAEADTQPENWSELKDIKSIKQTKPIINIAEDDDVQIINITASNTADDITTTVNEMMDVSTNPDEDNTVSSPYKDEEQRKKDFLDNTLEISPIKTMSPVRDKKSPSPETSSDYLLIKLSSPVQSNGEPFEKCDSPEIFTEDKVSPDKRDMSPPREENVVNNTSPSSSLSLKKNRPQVRSGGRAAQMLGLCVPDRLQSIMNAERSEPEEPKKNSPSNTPARRNLRILYNFVGGDNSENSEENEDSENFLKFKRSLPTTDCSPSGPILKRKLAEITDDATFSPASKRKRVSFHDPPVSTTISVQKYIEPLGIRSPQNSAMKRQERQNLRSQTVLKSPKRLENVFKLVTVLTKAVESFTEPEQPASDITQSMSLDDTPAVEIVKNSDLNDIDPICPELVDCEDPIDNIAADLSSVSMKMLLLKELEGKISTVGDLAKMTELEVNRLCIKAPKVKVAKKVLSDYASKRPVVKEVDPVIETIEILEDDDVAAEDKIADKMEVEVQKNVIVTNTIGIQSESVLLREGYVQTDEKITAHSSAQTDESGAKSTEEIISSCLLERPDFVGSLCQQLDESSKKHIATKLPEKIVTDMFLEKVSGANSKAFIIQILEKRNGSTPSKEQSESDLLFLQDYLCERFDNRDLILFCSQLLAKIHSKPS